MTVISTRNHSIRLSTGTTTTVEKAVADGLLKPHSGVRAGETKMRFALIEPNEAGFLVTRQIYNWAVEFLRTSTPEEEVGGGRMNRIRRANIALLHLFSPEEQAKVTVLADGLKTKKETTAVALEKGGIVALGSKRGTWGVIK